MTGLTEIWCNRLVRNIFVGIILKRSMIEKWTNSLKKSVELVATVQRQSKDRT